MRRQLIIFISVLILLLLGAWFISQSEDATIFFIAIYWVVSMLFLVGTGNYVIYRWLNHIIPWENDTLKRMLFQLLISGIYTLICSNLSYYLFKTNLTEEPPDLQQMTLLNIYAMFIIVPVFSIFFGIYFLTKWKKATIQIEDAKKEAIKSELLALKNHIDPHFLFNNLNILSSLIDAENESALSFLGKFSDVYRYVLRNKESEVIRLAAEMEFLDAYIFLINTRFGHQLVMNIDIDQSAQEKYIPTLTIQMLVENALKHNKFSRKDKLIIQISSDTDTLIVRNNYRPTVSENYEFGSGLNNIKKRYELLSSREPVVKVSNEQFIVEIPLLKID